MDRSAFSRDSHNSALPLHVNKNPQSLTDFFDNAVQKSRAAPAGDGCGFASADAAEDFRVIRGKERKNADPGTAQPTASDFVIERKIYEEASLYRDGDKRIGDRSGAAFGSSAHHPGSKN
jgi:hypothetical protein